MCRGWELNPHGPYGPMVFETILYANSSTAANSFFNYQFLSQLSIFLTFEINYVNLLKREIGRH